MISKNQDGGVLNDKMSVTDGLTAGLTALLVIGGLVLMVWSKISGKSIREILKELFTDD